MARWLGDKLSTMHQLLSYVPPNWKTEKRAKSEEAYITTIHIFVEECRYNSQLKLQVSVGILEVLSTVRIQIRNRT
jgi:hypothetical protein